jgi:hypothetical protein
MYLPTQIRILNYYIFSDIKVTKKGKKKCKISGHFPLGKWKRHAFAEAACTASREQNSTNDGPDWHWAGFCLHLSWYP